MLSSQSVLIPVGIHEDCPSAIGIEDSNKVSRFFLDALASLDLKLSVSQSVSESYFFRSSNSESVSH